MSDEVVGDVAKVDWVVVGNDEWNGGSSSLSADGLAGVVLLGEIDGADALAVTGVSAMILRALFPKFAFSMQCTPGPLFLLAFCP